MKRKVDNVNDRAPPNKRPRVNNNEKMHDRNKYKDKPPNFFELGQKYETFAQYIKYSKKGPPTIDFTDPEATRELTKVLLDHDYGVKIELPADQLCPTVTSRANYVHWLEDVLKYSRPVNANNVVRGIDIGTGASCIYPLLGVAINDWSFVATDIDDKSLELAQKNIDLNNWRHKIELRKPSEGNILLTVVRDNEAYDFCMCNPPFFSSVEEKGDNPQTVCTATSNELATEGGELEFVGHIIRDSLELRDQVRWYSSMIGRKVNVAPLLKMLHDHRIHNIRQTTFYQGRTTRWAIAWSFSNDGFYQIQREARRELNMTKKSVAFILHNAQSSQVQKIIQQVLENESLSFEYHAVQSLYYVSVEGGSPFAASWYEFNGEDKNHREGQLILKMSLQIHQSQDDQVMVISKLMSGEQHLYVMFVEYLESIFDDVRDVEDE